MSRRILRRFAILSGTLAGVLPVVGGCALSPEPLTANAVSTFAADKLSRVVANQEPVHGPIDLYEAMARALKYNLDYRVEVMQKALKLRELDVATAKMLPSLVANSGYSERNNDTGGISQSLATHRQSLEASTSADRRDLASDLTFSWNILDFGLSYIRARQAGDEALIAEETKRKVIIRVIEDVRSAYWRAVSSERLVHRLQQLEGRVRRALADSRKLFEERQSSPVTALTYERELVEIKRETQRLEGELKVAKSQLAALMNIQPGTSFQLVHAPHGASAGIFKMSGQEMIEAALNNRPEIGEVHYKSRINQREADAALLELLPGLQLYAGANGDSNSFLFNDNWVSWGAKASWNAMRVFQYPARREAVEGQDRLLDQRALALTMAIITQVHVSRIRYTHSLKELTTAREYLDVQRRLIEQMRAQAASDKISEQTLIREEMNTLVAEVKRDIAYATMQNALGNVYSSIGFDPYGATLDAHADVRALATSLRTVWADRGGFTGPRQVASGQ